MKKIILTTIGGVVIISGIIFIVNNSKSNDLNKQTKEINHSINKITPIQKIVERNITNLEQNSIKVKQPINIITKKNSDLINQSNEINQSKSNEYNSTKKIKTNKTTKISQKTSKEPNNIKFIQIFEDNDLYIFIQTDLKNSLSKDEIHKLVINLKHNVKRGTIFIEKTDNNDIFIKVLDYKISISKDNNSDKIFAKNNKYIFKEITTNNNEIEIVMIPNTSIKQDTIQIIKPNLNGFDLSYHFAFNSYKIDDKNYISSVKNYFSSLKNDFKDNLPIIIINGYTDNIGSDSYNLSLSTKRALALKKIISEYGFKIEFMGYGKANPIASNDTEEGRTKNRRIEIFFKR